MKLRLKHPPESVTMGFTLCALLCVLAGKGEWAFVFLLFAMVSIDSTGQ